MDEGDNETCVFVNCFTVKHLTYLVFFALLYSPEMDIEEQVKLY